MLGFQTPGPHPGGLRGAGWQQWEGTRVSIWGQLYLSLTITRGQDTQSTLLHVITPGSLSYRCMWPQSQAHTIIHCHTRIQLSHGHPLSCTGLHHHSEH